ncbi:hypothetical protein SAMN04488099_11518 [Alkalibacterium pelagium]|uniref:Uncharacterized protein n=1 Tax=Alkalibacterium pelagium TaxID=426702 RepID=A0A1H7NL22_9LACT|nr:hypothetical protein SAMN04488099_11518 [Alkalibacterium pelagium]
MANIIALLKIFIHDELLLEPSGIVILMCRMVHILIYGPFVFVINGRMVHIYIYCTFGKKIFCRMVQILRYGPFPFYKLMKKSTCLLFSDTSSSSRSTCARYFSAVTRIWPLSLPPSGKPTLVPCLPVVFHMLSCVCSSFFAIKDGYYMQSHFYAG